MIGFVCVSPIAVCYVLSVQIDWSTECVLGEAVARTRPTTLTTTTSSCADEYHLFSGGSLFIGEKIIAMHLLPGGAW